MPTPVPLPDARALSEDLNLPTPVQKPESLAPGHETDKLKESADLKNQYNVILINQIKFPQVNASGAEFLAAWLVSPEGQKAIGEYGKAKYGQALFTPDASSLGTLSE